MKPLYLITFALLMISPMALAAQHCPPRKTNARSKVTRNTPRVQAKESTTDTVVVKLYNVDDSNVKIPRPMIPLDRKENKPSYMRSYVSGPGFSFGSVMMLDEGAEGINYASSLRYGLKMIGIDIPISRHFVFNSSVNMEFNSIHLKNNQAYHDAGGNTLMIPAPEGLTYDKSRLHVTYLTVPIMLQYRFGGRSNEGFNFGINFGPELKFRTASSSKVWYHDRKSYDKLGTDMNLNPVAVDLRLEVSFRGLGLYATYGLMPMFVSGKGPKTNLLSFGGSFFF